MRNRERRTENDAGGYRRNSRARIGGGMPGRVGSPMFGPMWFGSRLETSTPSIHSLIGGNGSEPKTRSFNISMAWSFDVAVTPQPSRMPGGCDRPIDSSNRNQ